jgi:hypothetical protein
VKYGLRPWIALVYRRIKPKYYSSGESPLAPVEAVPKNPAHVVGDDSSHRITSIPSSGKVVKHTLSP